MIGQKPFDEMDPGSGTRPAYLGFARWLDSQPAGLLEQRRREAEALFRRMGITFLVYGEGGGTERLIPFDILPRIFTASEWARLEAGCIQRVRALNMFLHDVYHGREICRAGLVPEEAVVRNPAYQPEMHELSMPHGVYAHVAGIDVVRTDAETFYVLEDNLRTPSGVSYMLENRDVMMRLFPEIFARQTVRPVSHYPERLVENLKAVAPAGSDDPTVALLTPGRYNSAYFEHVFLAEQMGIELVEGQDLFVADGQAFMRTTAGRQRIDVLYRRIDDEFLDPLALRADSALGVPGLLSVLRSGRLTLANAMGAGVADDKSIYPYVPKIVRFYLGEEPLLQNVPTYLLGRDDDLAYTLDHLAELVVKQARGSGGYGMLVGPAATAGEREAYRHRILADPSAFIAQPTLALSTCPTFVAKGIAPRHVDLRPFVLSGAETAVVPGGLTRVALREGSLVVNSSQGGGTKDTWILAEDPEC